MKVVPAVFALIIYLFTKAQAYTTCEEHKICYINFTVTGSHNNTQEIKFIHWKTNIHAVSDCDLKDPCTTYTNYRDYATPSVGTSGNEVFLFMRLSNINRKKLKSHGNVWSAVAYYSDGSSKVIYETTLLIIVKPKQLTCAYNSSVNGLLIDCLASKSYPESKCSFSIKFNEVAIGINNTPEYNYTKLIDNDKYFMTRCTLNIPMENIITGHYELHVRVFPSSSDTECEDCGNTTITLDIEKPKVELIRCSTHVFQGTRLDCICTKSDSSDLASQVTWYQGNSILQQGENISVLITTVSKAHNYTCQSENAFGWTSNKEIYIPNIISKKDIELLKCSDNKPYSCLPHGICYGDDEFCYNGQVESCSPFNLSSVTFKKWCETQGHLKRNGSCYLACDIRVGLPEEEGQTILISIAVTVIAVLLILLVVLIVLIICCLKPDLLTKKLFKSRKHGVQTSASNQKALSKRSMFYRMKPLRKIYGENQVCANTSSAVLELEHFLPRSTGRKVLMQHLSEKHYSQICVETFSTQGDEDDVHFAIEERNNCKRESNHTGLILCTDYLKNPKAYLPEYDQESVKLYINICINLTVRLAVNLVSTKRPVNDFGAQKNHALTGSGIIVAVKLSETYHHVEHHDQTEKQSWSVYIATATQVVFDQTEAECTIAELFYDDEHKSGVKKLQAIGIHQYNKDESCIIECITYEETVYKYLKQMLQQQKQLHKALPCIGNSSNGKLVVISHPHGLPKHISFGERIEVCTDSSTPMFNLSRWKYTAAACDGSAGAPVLMLNNCYWKFSKQLIANFHVHSGVNAEGYNVSGSASVPKNMAEKLLSKALHNENDGFNYSENEFNLKNGQHIFEYRSDDATTEILNCKKNPGHRDFVAIKNFTKEHLPNGYREDLLYLYFQ